MRRTRRNTLYGTAQVSLVLLLMLLAACRGSAAQSTPPTASATAGATPTATPAATQTAAPQPSATASLLILTGATLGGTRGGFTAVYGPSAVGDLWNVRGLTFSLQMDTGVDGQNHAFALLVYRSDGTDWTLAQAQQACALFLPHDVTSQGQVADADGNPEYVFTSALLAATFARSAASYDPHGILAITYAMYNSQVFQCSLHIFR